jgi:predicted component of type VI protein secretion system
MMEQKPSLGEECCTKTQRKPKASQTCELKVIEMGVAHPKARKESEDLEHNIRSHIKRQFINYERILNFIRDILGF